MKKLKIIRLGLKYEKQNVIVRLLPNMELGNPVSSFCVNPNSRPKVYRYYSYALFNGEFCVFEYSALTVKYIRNKIIEERVNIYDLRSNYALKIFVDVKTLANKKYFIANLSDYRDDSNIIWNGKEESKNDVLKNFEKDTTMNILIKKLHLNSITINNTLEFFEL